MEGTDKRNWIDEGEAEWEEDVPQEVQVVTFGGEEEEWVDPQDTRTVRHTASAWQKSQTDQTTISEATSETPKKTKYNPKERVKKPKEEYYPTLGEAVAAPQPTTPYTDKKTTHAKADEGTSTNIYDAFRADNSSDSEEEVKTDKVQQVQKQSAKAKKKQWKTISANIKVSETVEELKGDIFKKESKGRFVPTEYQRSDRTEGSKFGQRRDGFKPAENRGGFRDRENRGTFGDRDNKGAFGDRENKGGFGDRENKGGFGDRSDKGGFGDRSDKGGFGDRSDKGGFGDRPPRDEAETSRPIAWRRTAEPQSTTQTAEPERVQVDAVSMSRPERPKFSNKKLVEKKTSNPEPVEEKKPDPHQMSAPEKPKQQATVDPWNETVDTGVKRGLNAWNRPLSLK